MPLSMASVTCTSSTRRTPSSQPQSQCARLMRWTSRSLTTRISWRGISRSMVSARLRLTPNWFRRIKRVQIQDILTMLILTVGSRRAYRAILTSWSSKQCKGRRSSRQFIRSPSLTVSWASRCSLVGRPRIKTPGKWSHLLRHKCHLTRVGSDSRTSHRNPKMFSRGRVFLQLPSRRQTTRALALHNLTLSSARQIGRFSIWRRQTRSLWDCRLKVASTCTHGTRWCQSSRWCLTWAFKARLSASTRSFDQS